MNILELLLYWLLIVSFALGNLYKFSFFSPDVHVSLLDLTVILTVIIFLLRNFHNLKIIYRTHIAILKPLFWFSLTAFTSLFLSIFKYGSVAFFVGSLYLIRFIFLGLFFVGIRYLFAVKNIHKLLITLSLVVLITGLGQYLFSPDVRSLAVSEWDPHYFRVVGTLLDPGFVGELLLMVMVYLFTKSLLNRHLNTVLIILSYLAFSLTYSRSSFLAAYGAVILFSYLKKSWRFLIFGVLLLSITLFLLPRAPGGEGVKLERTSSITARILNWKNSLAIFSANPVLGVGFNTYRYAQKQFGYLDSSIWLKSHAGAGADSSLLFVAATTGIIGFGFYLWYLLSLWSLSRKNIALELSLLTLLIHSLFLNSLFYPFILVWVSLLVAMGVKDGKSP